MLWLTAAAMLFTLGLLAGLGFWSRGVHSPLGLLTGVPWPRVSLIVPVAGKRPGLAANLRSLVVQDYPHFEVIMVTAEAADPAVPEILAALPGAPRARHVVAGPARGCGQKNHNLLAGLKVADPAAQVLVFCDSGHRAGGQFLRSLVAPLLQGWQVASGYHAVLPGDARLVSWGWAVTVLTLLMTKGVSWLNQPWGGATAIWRQTFDRLGVARLWSWTVVDDVSLAARLKRADLPVAWAAEALLTTSLAQGNLRQWRAWLRRQWLYLKFYLPGSWLAAGLVMYLTAGLLAGSLAHLFQFLWTRSMTAAAGLALAYLTALTALALGLRRRHPAPPPAKVWLAGCAAALVMGAWVHLCTCFTRSLAWHGRRYCVGGGGRVVETRTNDENGRLAV